MPENPKIQEVCKFNFKETKPDLSTMGSRFRHFVSVTDPRQFMVPDAEIRKSVDVVLHYKKLCEAAPNGDIEVTSDEREQIMKGIKVMNSSTNDVGDIVALPFRMCGFVPVNIPILCGVLLAPPTIFNTILF